MANPTTAPTAADQIVNGVKFVADVALLPGSSQLVEGKVLTGVAYGAAGIAARAFLGPWAWIVAGLDSYSVSASDKHLWQHFSRDKEEKATPAKKGE